MLAILASALLGALTFLTAAELNLVPTPALRQLALEDVLIDGQQQVVVPESAGPLAARKKLVYKKFLVWKRQQGAPVDSREENFLQIAGVHLEDSEGRLDALLITGFGGLKPLRLEQKSFAAVDFERGLGYPAEQEAFGLEQQVFVLNLEFGEFHDLLQKAEHLLLDVIVGASN